MVSRHAQRRGRQARLRDAGLRPVARGAHRRRHPRRGRRRGRGRGAQQQVDLQHARAHQRPHGQGRQGRRGRRRARSPPGAVRLLRPRAAALQPGDIIQMLNIGGVLGVCDSDQPGQGQAVRLPRARRGAQLPLPRRAHRRAGARRPQARSTSTRALDTRGVPVVALAGTCMEAGKTAAACAVIARMRHRGLTVDAFKATGVSLRRDILAMEDAGARRCAIFTDLGVVTTTRAQRPGAHPHHAERAGRRQARRDRVRARRRHPRHLRRRCHPRVSRHPQRAHAR